MCVHEVKICSIETFEGGSNGGADPGWGVIERVPGDATGFCDYFVGVPGVLREDVRLGECASDKDFGGAVVWGGVECADLV